MTHLFAPLSLRDLTVPNRAWVSPMCMYACEDPAAPGVVGPWHAAHYGQFALGGAGLILTEATAVLPEGRVTPHDAGLWSDAHVAPWRAVTDAVHACGGRIGVQLAHAGRKAGHHRNLPGDTDPVGSVPLADGGWTTVGATDQPFGDYAPPRAATEADLAAVVAAFGAAALRAHAAGFDAVELHGAHGYLLHELLSPVTNPRTDSWGGSRSGRERLLVSAVRAVRAAVPDGMPVLVRLSVPDVAPGGLEAADSASLAVRLVDAGADLIDCSSGGLVPGAEYRPAPGYQVPGSAAVRAAGVRTAAVGLIEEPWHAEDVLRRGEADAVLLGRAMLRDPHWARHAAVTLGDPAGPREPRYHRAWRRTVLAG
jgi:2,4-dienoyl-CoA reductase-like NADH-dependent reductase (Old Yellow Enzyme family)